MGTLNCFFHCVAFLLWLLSGAGEAATGGGRDQEATGGGQARAGEVRDSGQGEPAEGQALEEGGRQGKPVKPRGPNNAGYG